MRQLIVAPLMVLFLAGCGGAEPDQEEVGMDQVARAAQDMPQPQPGEYRSTVQLIDFNIPGVDDAMQQQMRAAAENGMAQDNTFCLTEEEAAQGPERMVQNMADSNCTFQRFDVSGGTMDAVMSCSGEGGIAGEIALTGTMAENSSSIVMDMNQQLSGAGDIHMKMKVDSQRVGDCE